MRPWEHRIKMRHCLLLLGGMSLLHNSHYLWELLETSGYVGTSNYWYQAIRLSSPYLVETWMCYLLYLATPLPNVHLRLFWVVLMVVLVVDALQEIFEGIPETILSEVSPIGMLVLMIIGLHHYYKKWSMRRQRQQRGKPYKYTTPPQPKDIPYSKGDIGFRK